MGALLDELRKKYGTADQAELDAIGRKYSGQGTSLSELRKKYGTATREELDAIGEKYSVGPAAALRKEPTAEKQTFSTTGTQRNALEVPPRKGGIQAITADTGSAFVGNRGSAGGGRSSVAGALETSTQNYEARLKELDEIAADLKAFEMATQYAPANQRPVKDIGGFTSSQAAQEEYDRVMAEYAAMLKENGKTDGDFGRNVRYALEKGGAGFAAAVEGLEDAAAMAMADERVGKALKKASPSMGLAQDLNKLFTQLGIQPGEYTFDALADKMLSVNPSQDRLQDIENRYAPGKVGQVAGEVAQGVGGMVPSIAANAVLPGSGMAVLGVQAAGQSGQQALNEGATLEQAVNYGVLSGGLEAATEAMFGGLAGLGKGFLNTAAGKGVGKLITKLGTSKAGQVLSALAANPFVKALGDSLGEGVEEGVSAVLSPYLARITYDKDAETATVDEVLHDVFVGALTGGVFQGVGAVANVLGGQKNTASGVETGKGATEKPASQPETDANKLTAKELMWDRIAAEGRRQAAEREAAAQGGAQKSVFDTERVTAPSEQTAPQNAPQSRMQKVKMPPGVTDMRRRVLSKRESDEVRSIERLAKAAGVSVRIVEDMPENEYGRYENGELYLSAWAKEPLMQVAKHEVTHHLQEVAPELYAQYRGQVEQILSERGDLEKAIYARMEAYAEAGQTLDYEAALDEAAADFTEELMLDESLFRRLAQEDRNLAQRILDALKGLLARLKRTLSGGEVSQLEQASRAWEAALKEVSAQKNTATASGAVKSSIKNTADGHKYVQADRQVIFGNDPESWSEQLEDYINGKIRRGQDVQLVAEDGDVLVLTATTAGKMSDNHTSRGTTLDDEAYNRKVNAATHVDELAQVSTRGRNAPKADVGGRHGDMAAGGWDYRTAYFRDFDGKYYRVRISVAMGSEGNVVYNIGEMQERSFPTIDGSSAKGGALGGKTSSANSISISGEDVNSKSSLAGVKELERQMTEERLAELREQYGTIKKGENPVRDVQVPKRTSDDKKVSRTIRTVMEAAATPEEVLPGIEALVAEGEFSYEVYGDKAAISEANEYISNLGWGEATRKWFKAMEKGEVSKRNTAVGWTLYNNAVNSGDVETAIDVLDAMVEHQRNAAQALQATRILKKLSPETQLYAVQKSIRRLQQELNDRYGSKEEGAPKITIDPELAEQLLNAKDQKGRDEAMKMIYRDVGRQMPSRFLDKWTAWRYLAMLGNARTHVRNVVGNAAFAPVVTVKNLTATAIESAVNRVSGGRPGRSKSLVTLGKGDRALLSAAWNDYVNVEEAAMGGGKYSDGINTNKYIDEGRRVFGRTEQAKTKVGKAVSGTLGRAVEAGRKGNSKLLDAEDKWFSKPRYTAAMASYCKANGITAEQIRKGEGVDEARAYAMTEAQKATYRDTNAFSTAISQLGRYEGKNPVKKGISTVMEGILPFRKTPANILARGLEYSPAGIIKSLTYDLYKVKRGDMTAAEMIDDLSAGLTGTGLLGLGVLLAAEGLIRGHGGDDEDKREFEELMGHQSYSLEAGSKSVTLDWLAPEALPFFVGVNLWETTQGAGEEVTLSAILSAIGTVTEPLLEMSCLQSLNEIFDAVGYAQSEGLSGLPSALVSAATSYLTQAVPTLLGQLERSGQGERMTTYTEKNAFLTSDVQYTLGSVSGKLPGVDYNQIAYIDAWGRTETTGSVVERAFNNMLNPAYTSGIEMSEMEEELLRLYEATGESGVFPDRAKKYFTVNKERLDLNSAQYVSYAKRRGETAYDMLTELTGSKEYAEMSDADKVETVGWVYDYADAVAKAAISDYQMTEWEKKAEDAREKKGVSVLDYIRFKWYVTVVSTDGNSNTSQKEAEAALNRVRGLTREQKAYLWQTTNSSWLEKSNPFT